MFDYLKSNLIKIREKLMSSSYEDIVRSNQLLENMIRINTNKIKAELSGLREKQSNSYDSQITILNKTIDIEKRIINSGTIVLSEKEMITKLFNGHKIVLDPNDIGVATHIALDSIWEPPITKAWLSIVGENQVIFDIGANFGYYGMLAAKLKNRDSPKVYFFEPNPHLIFYINKTLSINWLHEQSIVENLAISDHKGRLEFNILKDYISSSSLHSLEYLNSYVHNKMHIESNETIKVNTTSLDDYCLENNLPTVDVIKMDIEGYEEKAYAGMSRIVQSSPNLTLFIEFTPNGYNNPKNFYNQMLNDFGNLYMIDSDDNLVKCKSIDYETTIGDQEDLVMLVFSKNNKLEERIY